MDQEAKKIILTSGVEAIVDYVGKVGPGIDAYRIILKIYSTQPKEAAGLIKNYEVWVSQEFLEDRKYKFNDEGTSTFALESLQRRFQESGNTVPRENGLKATNEHGIELGNPQNISESFARLNLIVTKSQAKWLREKAIEQNSNISAVVRNILDQSKSNK